MENIRTAWAVLILRLNTLARRAKAGEPWEKLEEHFDIAKEAALQVGDLTQEIGPDDDGPVVGKNSKLILGRQIYLVRTQNGFVLSKSGKRIKITDYISAAKIWKSKGAAERWLAKQDPDFSKDCIVCSRLEQIKRP